MSWRRFDSFAEDQCIALFLSLIYLLSRIAF